MTSENENILNSIKNEIEELVKENKYEFNQDRPITFNWHDQDVTLSKPRHPNLIEQKEYLKTTLRRAYFWWNIGIKRSQYYTLKGHLNKCQFECVIRFLENRGLSSTRDDFEKFKESKPFVDITQRVTIPYPVRVATIDVATNK